MKIFDFLNRRSASTRSSAVSWLVVGLGNPGDKYFSTRHNSGFLALDYIAQKRGFSVRRLRFKALCGEGDIAGAGVLYMKPQTFMNASGDAVAEAAHFYGIPPERIIVLCDDTTLAPGALRVRARGSSGGQKGLKSIIERLGSEDFPRIRLGIGEKPHPEMDLADWVLSRFTPDDEKKLFSCFEHANEALDYIISGDTEKAMSLCNRRL